MKLKKLSVWILVLYSTLVPLGILNAQDDQPSCDTEEIATILAQAQDSLQQALVSMDAGDIGKTLSLLDEAANYIAVAHSQCHGWYFEGNGTDVLGPLELEGGVYILEYSSVLPDGPVAMGVLSIAFENLDQDELIFDNVTEMRTEFGEFSGRKSVRIEGGRYLISVDAANVGDWTIQLVKP
jgi:hypothetical protein